MWLKIVQKFVQSIQFDQILIKLVDQVKDNKDLLQSIKIYLMHLYIVHMMI
ncbi:MAG: hypothetical protein CM15mV42_1810 [uncultured marine virus]|nr:MAG: hypothetical protein CM15mV42_1810 [uncultured marine virus]